MLLRRLEMLLRRWIEMRLGGCWRSMNLRRRLRRWGIEMLLRGSRLRHRVDVRRRGLSMRRGLDVSLWNAGLLRSVDMRLTYRRRHVRGSLAAHRPGLARRVHRMSPRRRLARMRPRPRRHSRARHG
jgi:hypothetical protein